jgi:hypothetical protein
MLDQKSQIQLECANILHGYYDSIKSFTDNNFRKSNLGHLQNITGLFVKPDEGFCIGYDTGYPCYFGHPAEFAWNYDIYRDFTKETLKRDFFGIIPRGFTSCRQERIVLRNDLLGCYIPAGNGIGPKIELYWGSILKSAKADDESDIKEIAKIVMIHELAHYVTHVGLCKDQEPWIKFNAADKFLTELTAEMATQEVLRKYYPDQGINVIFDNLLSKEIKEGISKIDKAIDEWPFIEPEIKGRSVFWKLFSEYRNNRLSEISSVKDIILVIIRNSKKIYDTLNKDNPGIDMDI